MTPVVIGDEWLWKVGEVERVDIEGGGRKQGG